MLHSGPHRKTFRVVDVIEEETVQATVNGQVTDGDRLRVRFVKGNCEVGNLLTKVLTFQSSQM